MPKQTPVQEPGKTEEKKTKSQVLAEFVRRECGIMNSESPDGVKKRAAFRFASRLPVGESTAAWGKLMESIPKEIAAGENAKEPNLYEKSAYAALMLYVKARNFTPGGRLGAAVKRLDSNVARSRLTRAEDSYDIEDLTTNLLSIVSMLASKGIGIDYGFLATDIFQILWSDESRVSVMQAWERGYAGS